MFEPTSTNITTAAHANIIKAEDIVSARKIDFVTRFDRNWEALREILAVSNPIRKAPGTDIYTKTVTGTLQDGAVAEGAVIPRSKYSVNGTKIATMDVLKYSKEVTIEAIKEHGYDNAVQKTDEEFLYDLQDKVTSDFYTFANNGTLHPVGKFDTFQMAMAMAKGAVIEKFKAMHRNISDVVAFVNALDVYEYLGTTPITVQSAFGFNYLTDFMGYKTVVLLSGNEVKRGRVIATPSANINVYYVDPSESDFAKAGLEYTTSGETNLIGIAIKGDYNRATSVSYAIMGMNMFAEYIDGIAVIDVGVTYTDA